MMEDVQRQMAGLSFQDTKTTGAYNFPPVGSQTQRSNSQPQQTEPRPQTPYYQPPEQPAMAGYAHPPPSYSTPQQPPAAYHMPPPSGSPYPPHMQQQPPPAGHDYSQPAYPGWRGPYYNAQSGSLPRPPYTIPAPYPPPQGGYYKQQ